MELELNNFQNAMSQKDVLNAFGSLYSIIEFIVDFSKSKAVQSNTNSYLEDVIVLEKDLLESCTQLYQIIKDLPHDKFLEKEDEIRLIVNHMQQKFNELKLKVE